MHDTAFGEISTDAHDKHTRPGNDIHEMVYRHIDTRVECVCVCLCIYLHTYIYIYICICIYICIYIRKTQFYLQQAYNILNFSVSKNVIYRAYTDL